MEAILLKKIQHTKDVYSFIFKTPEILTWKAGQFIYYKLPHKNPDSRGIIRPFTISSAPYEKKLRLTTKFILDNGSSFKKALYNLRIGNSIEVFSIGGELTIENEKDKYVFIAGGIGITPFRSILLDLNHRNKLNNIILLYGNKDDSITFKDELDRLEKENRNFSIRYAIEPQFIDKNLIKEQITDIFKRTYYISGPLMMVKAIENLLKEIGVESKRIKKDYFSGY